MKPFRTSSTIAHMILVCLIGLIGILGLTACQTQPAMKTLCALEGIDPTDEAYADEHNSPIIDIHTHMFNARYLPLKGIALGKRDKSFFTNLLPDWLAIYLTNKIVNATPTIDGAAPALESLEAMKLELSEEYGIPLEQFDQEPAVRGLEKILDYARKEKSSPESFDVYKLTDRERRELGWLGFLGRIDIIANLIRDDRKQCDEFQTVHQFGSRRVLAVRHMMDLGPVYDQHPSELLLDFQSEQIPRANEFQSRLGSDQIYFVAYNPFRDHWPNQDAQADTAMDVVIEAIEKHGAFGVKFYPPSGYRPIENDICPRPLSLFTPYPRHQWNARYKGLTDAELDTGVGELLDYCIKNHIPVFAHCSDGEFEARRGYGPWHADPKYWKAFLESESPDPDVDRSELRLCLGHAGGEGFWFGTGKNEDWGELVRDLCMTYEHVYAEVGVHGKITDERRRAVFVERALKSNSLHELYPSQYPYLLTSKIMYGSDWFMSSGVDPADFLRGYEIAFLHPRLIKYYKPFFSENAAEFLDLNGRIKDERLPKSVQERIREFSQGGRSE